MTKPVLLCILDGWGESSEKEHNAIYHAKTPNWDRFIANYPKSSINTSGENVGLPQGQMGNSEVGHMNIGAGRIILQDLPRINSAIRNNILESNPKLLDLINNLKNSHNSCHIMGLFSDGGVHAHSDHIIYLAKLLAKHNVNVNLHLITDGRDTDQSCAKKYIEHLYREIQDHHNIKIATISGRYYAMDRDQRWDRIKQAYDAIACGKAFHKASGAIDAIDTSYENNITDEFILPTIIHDYNGMKNGDAFIMANFRADRARQLMLALVDPKFSNFERNNKVAFSFKIGMTEYSDYLNDYMDALFSNEIIDNCLNKVLSQNNLKQLHIAETEKYAHVTYFFNGGDEKKVAGEDHILIDSPKVRTYDLKPEMSAYELTDKLIEVINNKKYDFIIVNYANADMVGHTGNMNAAIKAVEVIDECLGKLEATIIKNNGNMLITADHGNIETMHNIAVNQPHTAHTMSLVPLVLIGNNIHNIKLDNGKLCDIAPTILEILNINQSAEMTGISLINK